ncbi:hypothetical protein PMIN06_003838 [Paraphaeosphaeria minitans]
MSGQPVKKIKIGSPEYKALMAKRKAEREAAAANAPLKASSPSATGGSPAAGSSGIAASTCAHATGFQSESIPAPASTLRYADGTEVKDNDWTPQSPKLHGWSDEDFARVRELDYSNAPLAAVIQWRKDPEPAEATARKKDVPRTERPKAHMQHPVPASSSKPPQKSVPEASSKPSQHPTPIHQRQPEQSMQRGRGQQVIQSQSPRPTGSPGLPHVYHDPLHMRDANAYTLLPHQKLRNELMVRGLEIPKSDLLADYIEVLSVNDQVWSCQLLTLEQEVIGKLWVKEKVDKLMIGNDSKSLNYHDYGMLTELLIDHHQQTPDANELRTKLRPEEQRKTLLSIANRHGIVVRPEKIGDYLYIAGKIADFHARKVTAERTGGSQRPQFKPRERPIRPRLRSPRRRHDRDDAPPIRKGTKRQREDHEDEEAGNEANFSSKKARHGDRSIPIENVSAPVQARTSVGATPKPSYPSKRVATAATDEESVHQPIKKVKKRQRKRDDEEDQEPKHKKARVTAPGKKASKKEGTTTKTATQQSVSEAKDLDPGTKTKSKGTKRQRDEEEMKPAQKKSRQQRQDSVAEEVKNAAGSSSRQRKTNNSRKAGFERMTFVTDDEDDEFSDFIDDGSEDESAKKRKKKNNNKMSRAVFNRVTNFFKD